jgi:sRNA-binding carbon storage regulator CsrA
MKKNTAVYREQVFSRIQKENDEVMRKHDLH